ncbi:uncharacterized protein TRIREDRAFT_109367 [Trichoderma reesei QM6a]|uniref:Predicted protein n=2 Tax=Hypocrea jecorina TaxID=51453 RepID=G0RP15_HYPJQ|nr:uncharacterized protein TRIREDRAFT_109367 [Trichoderma reesei QM6a]EGR47111.1 predicted protein [Trichoderma reesei QM6a]ETR99678.1 hypothetical protein M419DRAFT_85546 [Trichoderma reesei RUT C-30]
MGESSILRLSHAQHQHTVTQRPRRSPRTGGQRIECDRCDGFPNGLEGKHDLPKDKERSLKLDFFDYTCLQEDIHAGGHAMLPAMRAAVTTMISYDQLPGLGNISAAITAPTSLANQPQDAVRSCEKDQNLAYPPARAARSTTRSTIKVSSGRYTGYWGEELTLAGLEYHFVLDLVRKSHAAVASDTAHAGIIDKQVGQDRSSSISMSLHTHLSRASPRYIDSTRTRFGL